MKTDLKREIAAYRARVGVFEVVDVPPLSYLMIDGHGDPNASASYGEAVSALFSLAYRLKFLSKRELDRDYTVMPLEGLWWSDDMSVFTLDRDKSQWSWTMLNLVPEWITAEHLARAREAASAVSDALPLESVRLAGMTEGSCVQTLHVGSYDDEGPVLERMHHEFIPENGLQMTGTHHEVYLSDPRRTDAARLRTILRQPVSTQGGS